MCVRLALRSSSPKASGATKCSTRCRGVVPAVDARRPLNIQRLHATARRLGNPHTETQRSDKHYEEVTHEHKNPANTWRASRSELCHDIIPAFLCTLKSNIHLLVVHSHFKHANEYEIDIQTNQMEQTSSEVLKKIFWSSSIFVYRQGGRFVCNANLILQENKLSLNLPPADQKQSPSYRLVCLQNKRLLLKIQCSLRDAKKVRSTIWL